MPIIVQEQNTKRMNLRVERRIKLAIQRAAALSGMDDSVFAMSAAYKAALETIASHDRTLLAREDYEAFFAALDGNTVPNETLRKSLHRHTTTIDSRS